MGVILGATGKKVEQEFLSCLTDAEHILKDLESAIRDVEQETETGVKNALVKLGSTLATTANAIKDCGKLTKEAE